MINGEHTVGDTVKNGLMIGISEWVGGGHKRFPFSENMRRVRFVPLMLIEWMHFVPL